MIYVRSYEDKIKKIESEKKHAEIRLQNFVIQTWANELSDYEKSILYRIDEETAHKPSYYYEGMDSKEQREDREAADSGIKPDWRWCSIRRMYDLYYDKDEQEKTKFFKAILHLEKLKFIKTKEFLITSFSMEDTGLSSETEKILHVSIDDKGEAFLTKMISMAGGLV
jgi:hypothetical protein